MTFLDKDLTCGVCSARGVNASHIDHCKALAAERAEVLAHAAQNGVSSVKADDLLAHVRSAGRMNDPASIVAVVIDLGWRPVIGAPS